MCIRDRLMDMEYVVDFVQMKRFDDPVLVSILEAMRTRGGKKISEEAWGAITRTRLLTPGESAAPPTAASRKRRRGQDSLQPTPAAEAASSEGPQPATTDPRLLQARGWYESAYEWRIVSFAMHAHARLNARAAGKVLFYVPAIDQPTVQMSRRDFDDMRALPNISTTAKLPGTLWG